MKLFEKGTAAEEILFTMYMKLSKMVTKNYIKIPSTYLTSIKFNLVLNPKKWIYFSNEQERSDLFHFIEPFYN